MLRLMGRAGAHPRGFVLGAVASTPERRADACATRWGFPAEPGEVTFRRHHDRVMAMVDATARPILEARWSIRSRSRAPTSSTSTG